MNIESVWHKVKTFFTPHDFRRDDQQHVMSAEEALDETIDNSFPASDPPGHFSVSGEDRRTH